VLRAEAASILGDGSDIQLVMQKRDGFKSKSRKSFAMPRLSRLR